MSSRRYNQAGDLLDAASRYELSYNERGQTDQIDAGGTPRTQQYAETGQSQRITSGSATFLYSLLGLQVAAQPTPATGDPLATGSTRYLRGPDGTLLGQRAAVVETDRIGTAQNPVTARFRYDPYGNVIHKTGSSDTPWRFAGAYFERFPDADPGSQAGLYKMGERFYDPRTGRWTQQDPLDQSTDLREGNSHMYAGADPVNRLDPTGRLGIADVVNVASVAAGVGCAAAFTGVGAAVCGAGVAVVGFASGAIAASGETSSVGQAAALTSGTASAVEGGCLAAGGVAAAINPAAGLAGFGLCAAGAAAVGVGSATACAVFE